LEWSRWGDIFAVLAFLVIVTLGYSERESYLFMKGSGLHLR